MKHITKKMGMVLLAFVMTCSCVMGDLTYAQAASVKKQAGKVYAEILDQYLQVYSNVHNNRSGDIDNDAYSDVNFEYTVAFYDDTYVPIYRIFDYNGDGTPELFIGIKNQKSGATIYDVYTFHKGKAVQLMEDIGYRAGTCAFRKNGIIKDCSSGSAFDYSITYHRLPKKKTKLKAVVQLVYQQDARTNKITWTKTVNGKETVISEKEAEAIQKKYEKSQAYTFYQLTDTAVKKVKNGTYAYSGQKNWRITVW